MYPTEYKITCPSHPAFDCILTRPARIFLYDAIKNQYPGHALTPLEIRGHNEHGRIYSAVLDNHPIRIKPTN